MELGGLWNSELFAISLTKGNLTDFVTNNNEKYSCCHDEYTKKDSIFTEKIIIYKKHSFISPFTFSHKFHFTLPILNQYFLYDS